MRIRSPFADLTQLMAGREVVGVIDGGAHRGETAETFVSIFPDATVHAFEPGEGSFQGLAARAAADPRIKAWKLALGCSIGSRSFYVNRSAATSSLLPRAAVAEKYKPRETERDHVELVQVTTLDTWWEANAQPRIDIVKLDVQGFELEALKGAQKLLGSGVSAVLAEVSFAPLYEGSCLYHGVATFLETNDFSLYQLYYPRSDSRGRLLYTDALFCRPDVIA